ncbi:MAG: hypothetical protein K2W93_00140 [Burkholderiaceae bacterium]|nr:hypothetical protein [Burkholderiaceae bacterium]
MNPAYEILIKLSLWLATFAGGAALGWMVTDQIHEAKVTREALAASETNRESERLNALSRAKTMDKFVAALRRESVDAADARGDLDRLLNHLASADPGDAQTCGAEHTRIRKLEDLLGEGARLVEEGSRLVGELRPERQALQEL